MIEKKSKWTSLSYIHNIFSINYKNVDILKKFITADGKILPARKSGLTAKQHRKVAKAIKRARNISFLPFINKDS